MTDHCESCDKIIKHEIKDKQIETNCHIFYDQFTITRYIVENPNIKNLSQIMKKYVEIHNKK